MHSCILHTLEVSVLCIHNWLFTRLWKWKSVIGVEVAEGGKYAKLNQPSLVQWQGLKLFWNKYIYHCVSPPPINDAGGSD